MIDHLTNAIMAHVALDTSQRAQPSWATVADVRTDGGDHLVKVMIQPEEKLTGWLPVPTMGIGNGGSFRVIPTEGMQCSVVADGNDADNYVVQGWASSEVDKHPDCPSAIGGGASKGTAAEIIAVSPGGGSWWRMCADGSVLVGSKTVVNIDAPTVNVAKDLNVGGIITATGNIISKADVSDVANTLAHLRATVNGHTHSGVQTGSGISGKLLTPD